MKRFFIVVFILIFLVTISIHLFTKDTNGQDTNYLQILSSYDTNYTNYLKAFADFNFARNEYQAFKTIASKDQYIGASIKMMQLRDEALKAYLTALRYRFSQAIGIKDDDKITLNSKIDQEITWYLDHEKTMNGLGNLETISTENRSIANHYGTKTQPVIYKTLFEISYGKVADQTQSLYQLIASLRQEIDLIDSNHDKNVQTVRFWLQEVDIKVNKNNDKLNEARSAIEQISAGANPLDSYNQAMAILISSQQFPKDILVYLDEIIKDLKTAD